jgi:hypothetical protein
VGVYEGIVHRHHDVRAADLEDAGFNGGRAPQPSERPMRPHRLGASDADAVVSAGAPESVPDDQLTVVRAGTWINDDPLVLELDGDMGQIGMLMRWLCPGLDPDRPRAFTDVDKPTAR